MLYIYSFYPNYVEKFAFYLHTQLNKKGDKSEKKAFTPPNLYVRKAHRWELYL